MVEGPRAAASQSQAPGTMPAPNAGLLDSSVSL